MLAGVVHEINNPLAVIQGYAQLLHERASSEDDQRDLQCILDETRRLATLVEDMLSFTRRGTDAVETVDLQRVVQAAVNLTTHEMRQARVAVVASLPAEPCGVRGSHGVYVQVLLNLLANARQSLEGASGIERGILLRIEAPAPDAPGVDLVVANNGPSIRPELREAIFEPFFTTKAEGDGSGLGLALCRELLARYGARLVLDPPGGGSAPVSFRLSLPRA
jgi:two-component system NtrC family sensor kinase